MEEPFSGPLRVVATEVEVVETPKQYRLVKDGSKEYRSGLKACGYRTTVNKSGSCPLYETRADALAHLYTYWERQYSLALAKVDSTKTRLTLVAEARDA